VKIGDAFYRVNCLWWVLTWPVRGATAWTGRRTILSAGADVPFSSWRRSGC